MTNFDLRFRIGRIPVRVHPLFWLIAVLFGLSTPGTLRLMIWVVIVFVSILIHELGHALAWEAYGRPSRIILHYAGGLTVTDQISWSSGRSALPLTPDQRIWTSFAGPLAGFLFTGVIWLLVTIAGGTIMMRFLFGVIPIPMVIIPTAGSLLNFTISSLIWVNFFWGVVNLLPVFPLDGGQISRSLMVKLDPWDGVTKSLWISTITGGIVALIGLIFLNSLYMALLFGLLALQSYQTLRSRTRGF